MIFAAVGVVGIPSGLICAGFTDLVEEQRAAKAEAGEEEEEDEDNMQIEDGGESGGSRQDRALAGWTVAGDDDTLMGKCYQFISGQTRSGRLFSHFILALIILNVLAVILESVESIERALGSKFWNTFEAVSVGIFTLEYLIRLWTAVCDPEHKFSRIYYATTFFGIIDFCAVFPFYLEQVLDACDVNFDATIFRVLRLFRLLQIEHFLEVSEWKRAPPC